MVGIWLLLRALPIVLPMLRTTRTQRSFQNDTPWTLKPCLCHASQEHCDEEAIVHAQLGANGKKIDRGTLPSYSKGVHFGPELFLDLVIPHNHTGPLIDSITWQEMPFHMVGPFWATDPIFPGLPGDLELFTAKEVAKLKELGVLNPPNMPGCLPLFPPLVSSGRGKVVSALLGTSPPNLDTHGIGQSLATEQDEESILSDSYSDHHSSTVGSSVTWDRHSVRSLEEEQKPRTTKHRDRDGYKSSDKDHNRDRDRECEKSKKSNNWHSSDRPCGRSPWCKCNRSKLVIYYWSHIDPIVIL